MDDNVRSPLVDTILADTVISNTEKIMHDLSDLSEKSTAFFDQASKFAASPSSQFVPLLNESNAERQVRDSSNDDHSINGSIAGRMAGNPTTSEDTIPSQNTTDYFSNSLLLGELNVANDDINDGDRVSNDEVVSQKIRRHFHLSRASITTMTAMIYEHLRKNGVPDVSNIKVTKLVPRNRDISTLSFISFKIDTDNNDVAAKINTPNFWPNHCAWKSFIHSPFADFPTTSPFLGGQRSAQHNPT